MRIIEREMNPGVPEFYSVATISLGELITKGWIDWADDFWQFDCYSEEQRTRLIKKIENRYWDREIGILPPSSWHRRFIGTLNEIMPKYKLLYKKIDDGLNMFQDSDRYSKSRVVNSEFPQTALAGNQDYASTGTDAESEDLLEGNPFDKINQLKNYDDVDVMILNDIDFLFSHLVSVSLNGF